MKNKSWLASCWFFLILFLVSPLRAADKVRTGFGSLASSHMVMYVAKEFGLFKKYSLDAEIVGHIPGAKAVVPLVSGDAQIIHAAGPPFVLGTLGGSDVVIFLGLVNTMPFYLVVHKDIVSPSQLRGKKMGVSTLGSSSDFSLRFGLKKLGIDPDKDVTILALGDSAIRSSALNNGTIHGGAYNLGEMLLLRRLGHRLLLDMALAGIEYQHTAVATTRSYLARNRRIVLNYSKAIIDGINQMKSRKEDTLRLMARHLRVDDRESLEAQYEENVNKLFSKKPYPTVSGVKTILDNIALKDERARHARPEQFVELGIVKELDDSGFIDSLYR